jgi:serine/threonine protein phosphatase 1
MDQQKEEALIWIREPFLSHQGDYGVVVVHGHTIVDDAQQHHNRIAVDTGAFRSLRLTCAVLQDENVSFLQQTLPGVARPARWAVGG